MTNVGSLTTGNLQTNNINFSFILMALSLRSHLKRVFGSPLKTRGDDNYEG